MIPVRQGDTKTFYVAVKGETGTSLVPDSAYFKFYYETTGTYLIKGTATCQLGTVYYQASSALLDTVGTFQNHWEIVFGNNDSRKYIQDVEVLPLFPDLPSLNYGDLTTLKRYARNAAGQIEIGNSFTADISETNACKFILDGERYIDGRLKQHVKVASLPLSSPTNEIRLAASVLGAYFLLTSSFLANAPGELSEAAKSLKTMADELVDGYINQIKASGDAIPEEHAVPSYQTPDKMFTEVGVAGVSSGDVDGVREDDDISEETN